MTVSTQDYLRPTEDFASDVPAGVHDSVAIQLQSDDGTFGRIYDSELQTLNITNVFDNFVNFGISAGF